MMVPPAAKVVLPTPLVGVIAVVQTAVLLVMFADGISSVDALQNAALLHVGMAAVTLLSVTVFHAPYGRYSGDTMVPFVVDTRAAWVLQEMPTIVAVMVHFVRKEIQEGSGPLDPVQLAEVLVRGVSTTPVLSLLGVALFLLHYIHRTFIFPFMIQPRSPTPIHVMLLANLYCCFNGSLQAAAWIRFSSSSHTPCLGAIFIGLAVFAIGMIINVKSDYALISLRRKSIGYSIPHGFAFEFVSCPNFFGEGVEWLGYTITAIGISGAAYLDTPAALVTFSFFLYTLSNTFPRGVKHHQWYLDTFKDQYARLHRKAVIPYVL